MRRWRHLVAALAYPALVGGAGWATWACHRDGHGEASVPLVATLLAVVATAGLERLLPYEEEWRRGGIATDLAHNLVNVGSNQLAVLAIAAGRGRGFAGLALWPGVWPFWAQLALAAVGAELGLYWVHRASHAVPWLWRLHAVHHSPSRLYCLNGERRHPLNHWLEIAAGPGLLALAGAGPAVLAVYGTMVVVHLLLQHGNLDLRLGPLRRLVAVAEIHRYHHLKDAREHSVNYGAFLTLWDHLFGTYCGRTDRVPADAIGLGEPWLPSETYLGHLAMPFRSASVSRTVGGRAAPR